MVSELEERVLKDDYPVYAGYIYVCDGVPIHSLIDGTVADLKAKYGLDEVMNCDLVGRGYYDHHK